MSFTDRQLELIAICKENGYGWKKFAISVEESGHCSPKQEKALTSMDARIKYAKFRKSLYTYKHRDYGEYAQSAGEATNEYL
jgi:hypothetical protein